MSPDLGNAIFELGGAVLLWLNVARLYADKRLTGVSLIPTLWFNVWSVWNLWYYHALGQQLSWYAGIGVAVANTAWVAIALYYRRQQ